MSRIIIIIAIVLTLTSCWSNCACIQCTCRNCTCCRKKGMATMVEVPVDWSGYTKETPTGMTVMAFPNHGETPVTVLSNDLKWVEMSLQSGDYHVLVFNQSTNEFGSFRFENMDSYPAACVRANELTKTWVKARAESEPVMANPEWLAEGTLEQVKVPEMDMQAMQSASSLVTDTVHPRNVVYSLTVRIHLKGSYNIRSARASLSGMADGYVFSTHRPLSSHKTQLLEQWRLTPDVENPVNGTLSVTIRSFGLPDAHVGKPEENVLNLSLLLMDDKTKVNYSFAVGDKFQLDEGRREMSLDLDEKKPVPDVEVDEGGSGGFDATVDDWGDDVKIDVNV